MTRPHCGYFWAALMSFWVVIGFTSVLQLIVANGVDWIELLTLPFNIGVHAYIIRLIWRP